MPNKTHDSKDAHSTTPANQKQVEPAKTGETDHLRDTSTEYGEAMDAKHAGHASTPPSGAVPGQDQVDRATLNLGPDVGPHSIAPANTKVPVPVGGAPEGYYAGGEKIPGQGNIHTTALASGQTEAQIKVKTPYMPLTPALSAAMSLAQAARHKADALEEIRAKEQENKDSGGMGNLLSKAKGGKGKADVKGRYVQGQTKPPGDEEGDLYGQAGDDEDDDKTSEKDKKKHAQGTRDAHKKGDLYGQADKDEKKK